MEAAPRSQSSSRRPLGIVVAGLAVVGLLAVALIDRGGDPDPPAPVAAATPDPTDVTTDPATSSTAAQGSTAATTAPSDAAPTPAPAPSTADEWPARRIEADPLAIGAVDAPVVMVEYADFQCPFCGVFARETLPDLLERYVETGQLRIEWRDLPYIGPESFTAARAGRAAAAQGQFWAFAEAVYAVERTPNRGGLSDQALAQIAADIGLDLERFDADRADPALDDSIAADIAEADSMGLMSTPGFVINGQLVMGAQPLDVFVSIIDDALAAAG